MKTHFDIEKIGVIPEPAAKATRLFGIAMS